MSLSESHRLEGPQDVDTQQLEVASCPSTFITPE